MLIKLVSVSIYGSEIFSIRNVAEADSNPSSVVNCSFEVGSADIDNSNIPIDNKKKVPSILAILRDLLIKFSPIEYFLILLQ